ncbi:MAG: hypothetical protein LBT51_03085 [Fusobacteriaceae bacterium]|jgi:hypothetical protein|nr:hypothetical protein [Fusobacteriaceae bacterium]
MKNKKLLLLIFIVLLIVGCNSPIEPNEKNFTKILNKSKFFEDLSEAYITDNSKLHACFLPNQKHFSNDGEKARGVSHGIGLMVRIVNDKPKDAVEKIYNMYLANIESNAYKLINEGGDTKVDEETGATYKHGLRMFVLNKRMSYFICAIPYKHLYSKYNEENKSIILCIDMDDMEAVSNHKNANYVIEQINSAYGIDIPLF